MARIVHFKDGTTIINTYESAWRSPSKGTSGGEGGGERREREEGEGKQKIEGFLILKLCPETDSV